MTRVTLELVEKDNLVLENVDNLTGPTGTFFYWQVVLQEGDGQVRKFFHERYVNAVHVEGEEQIIEAAQNRVGQSQDFARTLGLEQ